MLGARLTDSRVLVMLFRNISDWFTFNDYDRAKEHASDRIVERQSRGNISAQRNGIMSEQELHDASRRADKSMQNLQSKFKTPK